MEAVRSYEIWSSRIPLPTCAMDQCIIGDSRTTPSVVENYDIHSQTYNMSNRLDNLPLFLKPESCEKT